MFNLMDVIRKRWDKLRGKGSVYIPESHETSAEAGSRKSEKSRREKRQAWLRRTKFKRNLGYSRNVAKGFRLRPWRGAYYEAIPSQVERPRDRFKNHIPENVGY